MTTSGSGQAASGSEPQEEHLVEHLVGQLVVLPGRPELGLGRLERFVRDEGQAQDDAPRLARVWLYQEGRFHLCARGEVAPAPPGVWPPREDG